MIAGEAAARAWLRDSAGCEPLALERLERFVARLRAENEQQNLVAADTLDRVWVRHIADSAQLLRWADLNAGPWLDLGTGAGFPGLIVAVLRPDLKVVLVESRTRRVRWLESVVADLGLASVEVLGQRLESAPRFSAETISARAFAPLGRLLALAAPFSTTETTWLLPKGRNGFMELEASSPAIRDMFHVERSLTDPDSAILVGRGVPSLSKRREVR